MATCAPGASRHRAGRDERALRPHSPDAREPQRRHRRGHPAARRPVLLGPVPPRGLARSHRCPLSLYRLYATHGRRGELRTSTPRRTTSPAGISPMVVPPRPRTRRTNMPKRTDIKRILVIGSGPIVIGQACEFDYSGARPARCSRRMALRSSWSTPTRRPL